MRRKPVNPDAAQAEAVDYLLREFKALRTEKGTGAGASTAKRGPIEPTYLVASANARDEIKAVADFVCDGTSDQEEINAAIAAINSTFYESGRVQLTDGYFNCDDRIYLDGDGQICLAGVGADLTWIGSSDDAPAMRDGLVDCITTPGHVIQDLTIDCDHGNYYASLTVVTGSGGMTRVVNCNIGFAGTNAGTRGAVSAYGRTIFDNCVVTSNGNGIDVWAGDVTISNCYFLSTGTLNSMPGAAVMSLASALSHCLVTDSYVHYNCVQSVNLYQGDQHRVTGNYLQAPIVCDSAGEGARNMITGNLIEARFDHGIILGDGARNNHVANNVIWINADDADVYDGIHLKTDADDNTILLNRIYAESGLAGRYGVNVADSGCNDNIVKYNEIDATNLTAAYNDAGTATVFVDADVLAAVVKHDNFNQAGALSVGSGAIRYYTQTDRTITGCYAMVSGAPSGSAAIFDVNIDGTTAYTTQGNRPTVAAAGYLSTVTVPDVTAWDTGSYLTIDVDAANSATDLILVVEYTEA